MKKQKNTQEKRINIINKISGIKIERKIKKKKDQRDSLTGSTLASKNNCIEELFALSELTVISYGLTR